MSDENLAVTPLASILPPYRLAGTNGHLDYADGRSISCAFDVSQSVEGGVTLVCEHDQGGWVATKGAGGLSPCRFRTDTPDGLTLIAEGDFTQTLDLPDSPPPSRAVQVRYHVSRPVRFASRDADESLTVRFSVMNLVFAGSVPNRYETAGGGFVISPDVLPLVVGNRQVALTRVRDFDKVVTTLRVNHKAGVTAILSTKVAGRHELDSLAEDVTRLCALLTLATGAKVNWSAYEARSDSGALKGGMQRSAVMRPLSTFDLIPGFEPAVFTAFIQTTYSIYQALEVGYELGRVVDARVDATAGGFLETRSLLTLVLTDFLTGRYAQLHQYRARSFEERLRFMVKGVCPDYGRSDIKALINSRDSLVHEMRFLTADKNAEYRTAIHLVNRLVLGLLCYAGRTWTVARGRWCGRNLSRREGARRLYNWTHEQTHLRRSRDRHGCGPRDGVRPRRT